MNLFQITIVVLYALAILVMLVFGLNLLVLSVVHVRKAGPRGASRRKVPGRPSSGRDLPFVTVQIPVYNEALVVGRVIDACAAFDYATDRFEIQVLDDSTDHTSAIVAECARQWRGRGVSVVHIRRADRAGFKAGALQRGLETARGDLIAIFDADFVPRADFLRRIVPGFERSHVGMIQARWGHTNAGHSLLTRVQAFGLDTHFALEQHARSLSGCFINFNGTAGVWRRACIEDAGGWSSDTLTEDLDISYRAQLRGWTFEFLPGLNVPAELPVAINAFRAQQFRWTKGALQTARKLMVRLWRSSFPLRVRLEGTLHLSANVVFPFIVVAALLHAPLVFLQQSGSGPGDTYYLLMSSGLVGFVGFFAAQSVAQRFLYNDWKNRLKLFPFFMASGVGISLTNTRAFLDVILGRHSPFVRTPKHAIEEHSRDLSWWRTAPEHTRIPTVAYVEMALTVYLIAGLAYVLAAGAWAAVPFQMMFLTGYAFSSGCNLAQARLGGGRRVRLPSPRSVV